MEKGFVKVPRAVMFRKEFSDPVLFYAYFALMSNVRFTKNTVDGITVNEGQLLMSKTQLSELFRVPVSRTRSILDRFEKMGGIKRENIKNRYTLITVLAPFVTGEKSKSEASSDKKEKKKAAADFAAENKTETVKEEITEVQVPEKSVLSAEAVTEENTEQTENGAYTAQEKAPCINTGQNIQVENKKPYGIFKNVLLTDGEYYEFRRLTPNFAVYIDSLSGRLMNSSKQYANHYALLVNNLNEQKLRNPRSEQQSRDFNSRPASYDILLAEERAKNSVPKVKKRERR